MARTVSRGVVQSRASALFLLLCGLLAVVAFAGVGHLFYGDFALDLGKLNYPPPALMAFLGYWTALGTVGLACFSIGITRLVSRGGLAESVAAHWRRGSDRAWVLVGAACGCLLPYLLRRLLLRDVPLSDDEGSYLFSAQLLEQGRLYVESPVDKIFFDRQFMVNDGRWYSQYFLGWPALMVPALVAGIPEVANPVYSALTVPALFLVSRDLFDSTWARVSVVLYLGSPQLMFAAATMLSHTSCLFALAWLTVFVLRSRGEHGGVASDAAVALCFGVAFFIRPLTAVGFGLPLLALWAWGVRHRRQGRLRAVLALGVPALGLAALFLGVNALQNGSPFRVAYEAVREYHALNGFRFTTLTPDDTSRSTPLRLGEFARGLALSGAAVFRLNGALFGWPCSLLFVLAAWGLREARLWWWIVGCYFVSHLFSPSVGIDSFGPVKYLELSLALILLSVAGLRRWISKRITAGPLAWTRPLPYRTS